MMKGQVYLEGHYYVMYYYYVTTDSQKCMKQNLTELNR